VCVLGCSFFSLCLGAPQFGVLDTRWNFGWADKRARPLEPLERGEPFPLPRFLVVAAAGRFFAGRDERRGWVQRGYHTRLIMLCAKGFPVAL